MRRLVAFMLATLLFGGSGQADEINHFRGNQFSIFTPRDCKKVEQSKFNLVVHCDIRGKKVRLYLKETSLIETRNLGKGSAVIELGKAFCVDKVFPLLPIEVSRVRMRRRLRFFSSFTIPGKLLDFGGYLYGSHAAAERGSLDDDTQRVVCRLLSVERSSAIVVALSDTDVVEETVSSNGKIREAKMPVEVTPMVSSLGWSFDRMVQQPPRPRAGVGKRQQGSP